MAEIFVIGPHASCSPAPGIPVDRVLAMGLPPGGLPPVAPAGVDYSCQPWELPAVAPPVFDAAGRLGNLLSLYPYVARVLSVVSVENYCAHPPGGLPPVALPDFEDASRRGRVPAQNIDYASRGLFSATSFKCVGTGSLITPTHSQTLEDAVGTRSGHSGRGMCEWIKSRSCESCRV